MGSAPINKLHHIFIVVLLINFTGNLNGQSSSSNDSLSQRKSNCKSIVLLGTFSAGYVCELSFMKKIFYGDEPRIPFYYANDSKSYLQVDKLQHSFCSYIDGYAGYHILRNAGFERNKALLFSGPIGIVLQTPKEFIDAHHFGSGFSWLDILSNTTGSAFFIAQELLFNEQVLLYKFSFKRSYYSDKCNGYLGYNYLQSYSRDYNGHTYWLSLNANKLVFKSKIPDWINLAVGYSANGMFGAIKNENFYNGVKLPETQRYRQFLLSLDVDWPEIKTRSKFLKRVLNTIVFIKLPFPAVEFNSKGQIKGYWLYF